jgi:hypothetical protein
MTPIADRRRRCVLCVFFKFLLEISKNLVCCRVTEWDSVVILSYVLLLVPNLRKRHFSFKTFLSNWTFVQDRRCFGKWRSC